MNRTRKIVKKIAAGVIASALTITGGSTVFAAESYKDVEKGAVKTLASGAEDYFSLYAKEMEAAKTGSSGKLTLKVEDTGKAMFGAMTGMDMSWLNTIGMDIDAAVGDGLSGVKYDFLLNEGHLLTMNFLMDMTAMSEYVQFPELAENYLHIPLETTMIDENGNEITGPEAELANQISANLLSMNWDGKTMGTLVERYGNLFVDHMEEGASAAETVSVEGVSEEATLYEGLMDTENAQKAVEDILTTAKDDQELKTLFDNLTEGADTGEDFYKEFQTSIDDALADLKEGTADAEDDTMFSSKVWVNQAGKIIGREWGTVDGAETVPALTWKNPSADGTSALLVEINDSNAGGSLTLTGTGTSVDGILNGDYTLAEDGVKTANINVANLNTKPEKMGYYNGTFTLTFLDNGTEENPNPMSMFSAVLNITSDAAAETSKFDLTVNSSGAPLLTLTMEDANEEAADVPAKEDVTDALDAADSEQMKAYVERMDWAGVLDNAKAAGMPEELASQIDQMIQSAMTSMENAETGEGDSAVTE